MNKKRIYSVAFVVICLIIGLIVGLVTNSENEQNNKRKELLISYCLRYTPRDNGNCETLKNKLKIIKIINNELKSLKNSIEWKEQEHKDETLRRNTKERIKQIREHKGDIYYDVSGTVNGRGTSWKEKQDKEELIKQLKQDEINAIKSFNDWINEKQQKINTLTQDLKLIKQYKP